MDLASEISEVADYSLDWTIPQPSSTIPAPRNPSIKEAANYLTDDGMEPEYCEIPFQMDAEVMKAAREHLRERVVVQDRDARRGVNKRSDENEQRQKLDI